VGEVLQRIGPQSQQQKLRPCEVCGSLLSVNGTISNVKISSSQFNKSSNNTTQHNTTQHNTTQHNTTHNTTQTTKQIKVNEK
jgi:ribosome-binding protein aMBF1 (putative translation factor)